MIFGATEDDRGYRGATITIKGTPYKVIGYPDTTRNLNNLRSIATVEVDKAPPIFGVGEAVPVWVDMLFEGKPPVRVYTGFLGPVRLSYDERQLTLVDNLFKLKNSPEQGCDASEAVFFDDLAPIDAMKKVLTSAGIAEADIDMVSLEASLSNISPTGNPNHETMRVCPIMAHCVEVNQKLEDLYRDLCTFLCIVGYCDADGKIRFVPKDTRPVENPTLVFDNDSGFPILETTRERGGFEEVVRTCTCKLAKVEVDDVEGAEYTSKWVSTNVENGVPYSVSISAPLVQTKSMADRLTTYYGELGCRQEQRYTIVTALDPHLRPGLHAKVRFPGPDYDPLLPSFTSGYIVGVANSGTRSTLTISTGPSEESGYQEGCKPTAVFTYQIVAEPVMVGGAAQTQYDVVLDGSGSFDADGSITSYAWVFEGTTPTVAPTATANTTAVVTTIEGVSVTLTVTDDNTPANSVSVTQELKAPGSVTQNRRMQAVKDGKWGILLATAWIWYSPPDTTATAVARYNEVGDIWCGCANGDIYKRSQADGTQTPTKITSVSGSIADIYVGEPFALETAVNSIIVAHGNKATWTHNQFTSATQSYDFGVPVKGVAIDPYTTTHLTALAGNAVKESWDDGVTWANLLTGATGSQAEDIGVAPWDTCVVFSGASGADAVKFLSGATWTGATLDGDPQTITPGVTTETFRVATSTSHLYLFTKQTDGSYTATDIGQADAAGDTRRIVRDGAFDIVYGADTGAGLFKQLNDASDQIFTLASGSATRIGYAGIGEPIPINVPALYMGSFDALQATIYRYMNGAWETQTNGLPVSGTYPMYCRSIIIDPDTPTNIVAVFTDNTDGECAIRYNANQLAMVSQTGLSPFWYTTDGGTTWQELIIPITDAHLVDHGMSHIQLSAEPFIRDGKLHLCVWKGHQNPFPQGSLILIGDYTSGTLSNDTEYWFGNDWYNNLRDPHYNLEYMDAGINTDEIVFQEAKYQRMVTYSVGSDPVYHFNTFCDPVTGQVDHTDTTYYLGGYYKISTPIGVRVELPDTAAGQECTAIGNDGKVYIGGRRLVCVPNIIRELNPSNDAYIDHQPLTTSGVAAQVGVIKASSSRRFIAAVARENTSGTPLALVRDTKSGGWTVVYKDAAMPDDGYIASTLGIVELER